MKTQQRLSQNLNSAGCEDHLNEENREEVSSSCQEDLKFLKIAVVNENNMDLIKSKIAATSEFRRQLIHDNHSIDLLESFPYFFHNQKLVTALF